MTQLKIVESWIWGIFSGSKTTRLYYIVSTWNTV